jgi:hypothetical protein
MAVLVHLFYPWGLILQGIALLHAVKRRPEYYWYYIILFGGAIGAGLYILAEIVPDAGLLRDTFKGFGRRSRIQQLELVVEGNPSAGNYEELADLLFEQKNYSRARDGYEKAIATRSDSLDAFYRRGLCSLALKDLPQAISDLERVCRQEVRYDHDRAAGSLAQAYALAGQADSAEAWFAQARQFSNEPEIHYNYACFLRQQGRTTEAREVAQAILRRKRGMPRYLKRLERPWFRKASAFLRAVPEKPKEPVQA